MDGFNCYEKQINTDTYNDYINTNHFLVMTVILKYQVI